MAGFTVFDAFIKQAFDAPPAGQRVDAARPATAMRSAILNRHRR
ncbi:hypothetical protein [Tabrizicola sp.]|jgi:hypothetical protein